MTQICPSTKTVAIVGSRGWEDKKAIEQAVNDLPRETRIVSGGARGADSLGALYARLRGLPVLVLLPDWDRYGKRAGFLRNTQIVEEADEVLAFWDGKSRGTLDTINKAKAAGKVVTVVRP